MGTVAGLEGTVLRFSGFELDRERAELRAPDGRTVRLRPKSLEILRLLAGNAGRVLGKQELMEAVWPNVHVGEDSLYQCIREIRTALGDDRRQAIKLASGRGYLFAIDVSIVPDGPAETADTALPTQLEQTQPASAELVSEPAPSRWLVFGLRGPVAFAAVAGLCAITGLAVAVPVFRPDLIFKRTPPAIAVLPIT